MGLTSFATQRNDPAPTATILIAHAAPTSSVSDTDIAVDIIADVEDVGGSDAELKLEDKDKDVEPCEAETNCPPTGPVTPEFSRKHATTSRTVAYVGLKCTRSVRGLEHESFADFGLANAENGKPNEDANKAETLPPGEIVVGVDDVSGENVSNLGLHKTETLKTADDHEDMWDEVSIPTAPNSIVLNPEKGHRSHGLASWSALLASPEKRQANWPGNDDVSNPGRNKVLMTIHTLWEDQLEKDSADGSVEPSAMPNTGIESSLVLSSSPSFVSSLPVTSFLSSDHSIGPSASESTFELSASMQHPLHSLSTPNWKHLGTLAKVSGRTPSDTFRRVGTYTHATTEKNKLEKEEEIERKQAFLEINTL
ncbi:hypothetical protein GYMLUDRAFT_236514 [Collybiopsis luxurians FD-317 M1]|nr:hypothetical protein GYMLUDRAFT_236514 [Collybiopsis luxurians FD-317 M1]